MTAINTLEGILKNEITKDNLEMEEVGLVVAIFDGIIIGQGLVNVMIGEKVIINHKEGMVLSMEIDQVKILFFDDLTKIKEGDFIHRTKKLLTIKLPVNIRSFLGRSYEILDLLQGNYEKEKTNEWVVDKEAVNFMDRQQVNESIQTGILTIDAMTPIGRGQRQLIVGNINTGKTTMVLDMIINQKDNIKKLYCIYVSIGQKNAATKQVENTLINHGAFSYSLIINAGAATNNVLQYITPYVAMAVAEAFQGEGCDVMVFFDDLAKHAIAYRSIKLLCQEIPGREAYSGDVFYLHARLLERCGKFSNGASITGIPLLSTYDVTGYIPTNVISITDGQLFLDQDLFNKGQRPAINIGISVSRLGGAVQSKFMKKVCGSLKIDLSAAEELEQFAQFITDLEGDSKKVLEKGAKLKKIIIQENYKPYKTWEEIVMLYGVLQDLIEDPSREFFKEIFHKIRTEHRDIIMNIEKDIEIDQTLEKIRSCLCN